MMTHGIESYPNATILPNVELVQASMLFPDRPSRDQFGNGGVLDQQGIQVTCANLGGGALDFLPEQPEILPDVTAGAAFYAGYFKRHFGHFLIESFGRLWAVQHLPKDVPLLYLASDPRQTRLFPFHWQLLEQFNIPNPVRIVTEPERFEQLYVAPDHFNLLSPTEITDKFRNWLLSVFPARPKREGPDLYVSRSELETGAGRYLGEKQFETILEAQGYQTFHPQQHSVGAQIQAYRAANRMIVAESSALHLMSMICDDDQKLAVITRRPAPPRHLISEADRPRDIDTQFINVVSEMHADPKRNAPGFSAISKLNPDLLGQVLAENGFISPSCDLRSMNDGAEEELAEFKNLRNLVPRQI